jgi:hypothetical protein
MRVFRSSSFVYALAGALVVLGAPVAGAQPSTQWSTYVLFAQDNIRIRTATIADGDVGVNDGLLYMRGTIAAPKSDFVANIVHQDSSTDCEDLFANAIVGTATSCARTPCPSGPGCTDGGLVAHPLVADIRTACGFTPPADVGCSSDPADDVLVDHNQTTTLDPSKRYHNVIVEGGGAGPAVLKLTGDYHFCNLKVGRNGSVLFGGPSSVTIAGMVRVSNATEIGPETTALPAGAIHWYVTGSQARFSRHGNVSLYVCAPDAKMIIGGDTTLTGRFAARSIRMKKSTITFAPPVPGVCGDGIVSPGECETSADCSGGLACVACVCGGVTTTTGGSSTTTTTLPECTDDADCNQGSAGGGFVCVDGHCVPSSSTTTTTTTPTATTGQSTTTTPSASTSSTTLHPCSSTADCPQGVCHDGVCVPECQTDADCAASSPSGGFVCMDGRCVPPGGEICGNCIDDDGDGLVDFEDPDCCAAQAGQLFQMDLRHARLRPRRATGRTLLRVKSALARSGLAGRIDPLAQQVGIQIRSADRGELLCASIPAGKFLKRKKGYVFSQKRTPLPPELGRNLNRVRIKPLKSGVVAFRMKGRQALLATPAEGTLQISVGFMRPGTPSSQNVCSQAVRLFRGGKKGQLAFP